MKKLVAVILMIVGLAALMLPEKTACPSIASADRMSSQISNESTLSVHDSESAQSSSEEDCQDCAHPYHLCHECHFGHCGIPSNLAKASGLSEEREYGISTRHFVLKSITSKLFRPPIV